MKQDPETGDVSLERDEDVVCCLVDVKENADWLADVERALASQRKPSQRLERLKDQAEETKVLRQDDLPPIILNECFVVVVFFLVFCFADFESAKACNHIFLSWHVAKGL